MDWIDRINEIISKQTFDVQQRGEELYNELDVVLSILQTNSSLVDLNLDVKNYISLLSNIMEKIAHLIKEISLVRKSFDYSKTIIIGEKFYYYNYRLDTYLEESDIKKLEESHRRCLELFKQFVRKAVYLIVTGKSVEKEEEEKPAQQLIPFIPLTPTQPQQTQPQEGEKK